jgi:hypothetical protein
VIRRPALPLALAASLMACTTVAAPPAVSVYKILGTRQCDSGGTTAQALADTLRGSGVTLLALTCGSDGRMRPAVCGAADGRIAIVDLAQDQQAAAMAQGWALLTTLPDARRMACAP